MKRILYFIVLTLAILFTNTGWAVTYYVDKDSLGGSCADSDSNSGSETEPWCTIDYGISKLTSGDTLYIRSEYYTFW